MLTAKLEFGLLADTASLDSNGKLSLLGEFNVITAGKFPATHPSMAIIAKLVQPTEDLPAAEEEVRIRIVSPGESDLLPKEVTARVAWRPTGELMPGVSECRILVNLAGLRLPEQGVYRIRFYLSGQEVASIPFLAQRPRATDASGG